MDDKGKRSDETPAEASGFPEIRVPIGWTLAGLVGGLAVGVLLTGRPVLATLLTVTGPIGNLWLKGLQMTILPLVVSLLVVGIAETMAAARAGVMATRTLGLFFAILFAGAVMAALVTPALLELFPVPGNAAQALQPANAPSTGTLPGLSAFVDSLVPSNVVSAAAADAILPTLVFFSVFAAALARVAEAPRRQILQLFEGLASAMVVVIGWVLWLAPVGVFALSLAVAAKSGAAAFGVLAHYIGVIVAVGTVVFIAAHVLAVVGARVSLGAYLRAMLPVEAVAISTQSSLACLPTMLVASQRLGVRTANAEFVLPLAVALLRATGPAMNLAVAIYVAYLTGVPVTFGSLAAGVAVACLTTLGAPSISGVLSYISSIAPIALAMGVPVAPLAILVAVEMLPDLMRTIGNAAMDVAVTATVDRFARAES